MKLIKSSVRAQLQVNQNLTKFRCNSYDESRGINPVTYESYRHLAWCGAQPRSFTLCVCVCACVWCALHYKHVCVSLCVVVVLCMVRARERVFVRMCACVCVCCACSCACACFVVHSCRVCILRCYALVCCSLSVMLQCVAVCCSVLLCTAVLLRPLHSPQLCATDCGAAW